MIIIILGPPGSGKGTVAKELSKKLRIPSISPGELLRKEIAKQTPLGKKIHNAISKGNLAPGKLAFEVVRRHIRNRNNYILDGLPRDRHDMMRLHRFLNKSKKKVSLVIFINTPQKICEQRIRKRGKLEKREDDSEKSMHHRFSVYHKQTLPVIREYRKRKLLRVINGNQSKSKVIKEALSLFE